MLKVRVQLINGQDHLVESVLTEDQFDDKIAFGSPTDLISDVRGIKFQISKILTHQHLGETNVKKETN